MAEQYPMNRLDTIVNGLQEMIPIAEERSPMMRDGKKIEAVQKLDQARRCIDKLDGMIDLKDENLRPEQPWKSDMDELQKTINRVDEGLVKTHEVMDKLSTWVDNISNQQMIQDSAISILAAGQARVEAKVDKLIRMQGYDPANFINGPEIMNNITGTPQDSPPPKRKRGRPKKGEEVHKKITVDANSMDQLVDMMMDKLSQRGLFPTYPPQVPYMYPQMFYPPQQGYMSQLMYNPYTGAPIQQPAQFNQQFYSYPQAQPVPPEPIKPNTTCSGVTHKNPNKDELDRYDLNVDYYAPPEELLQEAPKRTKKKNDKPSIPQEEDIIIPEPVAPIIPQPIQSSKSKENDSSKDEDYKDKPHGGISASNKESAIPEEPQVDETIDLFRGDATVEAYINNPIDRTEVRVDSYDQFYSVAKYNLLGAAYTLIESNGDEQCLKHVRNMMDAYHQVSKEVEVWHKFSSKDKKQILKAYSVTLKKFSSMKYDDNYPGFEEVFKLINYWFQRRFPIGIKNNFRYNPSCIPGWIEDIIMVMGNYVNTMWWKDKVEEFKRWCDGCQDKRCHYALPPTLMDEVRMQKIKANRNMIVWDIMNELGFFKYLNSMLPDVVTTSYYDVISWVWPQYALRYRLDCQNPKDEDFDVDDCSDPNLPAMLYAKVGRYTPGYSFTESNLSNFGWVPRETPKAQDGISRFLSPLVSSAFKLYNIKARTVTKKYRSIQNAVQVCYA